MIQVYVYDTEYDFKKQLGDFDIKDIEVIIKMFKKYGAEFNNKQYVFNRCYYDIDFVSFAIELIEKSQ